MCMFLNGGSFILLILSLFISSGPRKSFCFQTIPLVNFIFSLYLHLFALWSTCFSVSRLRDWFSSVQYFISMWLNNPCLLLCLELITHYTAREPALITNDYSRSGLLEKRACADISAKWLLPSWFLHISHLKVIYGVAPKAHSVLSKTDECELNIVLLCCTESAAQRVMLCCFFK